MDRAIALPGVSVQALAGGGLALRPAVPRAVPREGGIAATGEYPRLQTRQAGARLGVLSLPGLASTFGLRAGVEETM
jgi:hypothetical protein